MNEHSKYYERIKRLYDAGRINDLEVFVRDGLITAEEYEEICGEPYSPFE